MWGWVLPGMGRALACIALAGAQVAAAQETAASAKWAVGMSTALTGPNARYGNGLAQGVRAAFARFNAAAEGRGVELLLRDDEGQPDKAVANTRELLQARVVALTGYRGAASLEAVMPLIDSNPTPMVGAASSAESLRTPPRRWLFNLRAAAGEETAAMVYHLDTIGIEKIAAIAQDDGLGRAGLEGIRLELVRIGTRPVAVGRVSARPLPAEMEEAVRQVCAAGPQAVLLALDAPSALAALRNARQRGCRSQFYLLSETGSDLVHTGAPLADLAGVVVSQVLPSPIRPAHPLVADYLQDLAREAGSVPGYASLEGYLYGRVLTDAVRQCGRAVTRECIISALATGRAAAPGYRLQFSPDQRRGSNFVELTMIGPDGKFRR